MNKLHINKKPLLLGVSCKRKITVGIMAAILTLLAGPAFAFSDVFFKSGTTLDDYDFGTVNGQYIGPQPAFVDPLLIPLHGEPRFEALAEKIIPAREFGGSAK